MYTDNRTDAEKALEAGKNYVMNRRKSKTLVWWVWVWLCV